MTRTIVQHAPAGAGADEHPQFLEACRKLAERAIKLSGEEDQQLTTLFRLGARRHPTARELAAMKQLPGSGGRTRRQERGRR